MVWFSMITYVLKLLNSCAHGMSLEPRNQTHRMIGSRTCLSCVCETSEEGGTDEKNRSAADGSYRSEGKIMLMLMRCCSVVMVVILLVRLFLVRLLRTLRSGDGCDPRSPPPASPTPQDDADARVEEQLQEIPTLQDDADASVEQQQQEILPTILEEFPAEELIPRWWYDLEVVDEAQLRIARNCEQKRLHRMPEYFIRHDAGLGPPRSALDWFNAVAARGMPTFCDRSWDACTNRCRGALYKYWFEGNTFFNARMVCQHCWRRREVSIA